MVILIVSEFFKLGKLQKTGWATVLFMVFLCTAASTLAAQRVDASTVVGKVLVGYQGWFRCPGDGSQRNVWSHWFKGSPSAASLAIDLYPDTADLSRDSLCSLPGMTVGGKQAYVFSSFPKATSDKHFEWMEQYGIDGALVQRFVNNLPQLRDENDVVLRNIQRAAEAHGRVFAVEYDLSGALTKSSLKSIEDDWLYVTGTLQLTKSALYLKEGSKPLVSIWGLGFGDRSHLDDPEAISDLVRWFKETAHVTVMGGVPAGWRTLTGDSRTSNAWNLVYDQLDIVQPWSVGRYRTLSDVEHWLGIHLRPDIERTNRHRQMYMPVIFPGFSWHNLNPDQPENQIPRLYGEFLWDQAVSARRAGAKMVKIAMFDEVNEGTAIFKAGSAKQDVPAQGYWLTLDADGTVVPPDWYLQLAGKITQMFHGVIPATTPLPLVPSSSRNRVR
jgi:hypothetical protein